MISMALPTPPAAPTTGASRRRLRRDRRGDRRRSDARPARLHAARARRRRGIALYVAALALHARAAAGSRSSRCSSPARSCSHALGLSDRDRRGIALIAGGLALIWRHGGSLRPASRSRWPGSDRRPPARCSCSRAAASSGAARRRAPCVGALLLLAGPWLWRSRASATPSAPRGSGSRSAPRSPRACTTPCCRRSR